ncbi:MAG: hypothetical protein AAF798_06845 [Bacteroidota bacterium]
MYKVVLPLFFLLIFCSQSFGQKLEEFSEDPTIFLSELETFMTSSKRKQIVEVWEDFEQVANGGMFTSEEMLKINAICNKMLKLRMTPSPFFTHYLTAVSLVKKAENGDLRFIEWHEVLTQLLESNENKKKRYFDDFTEFSIDFFESSALRSSTSTSWYALTTKYQWKFEEGKPTLAFEDFDLMASRRTDSIFIYQTSGKFYPIQRLWKGEGGRVTWERFGLDPSVYAELGPYSFEVNKSLYEVENVKMHYPLFFGNKPVEGSFRDKLSAGGDATGNSYPRFESNEAVIELQNLGEGISYKGGFRLQGTTIYGYGNKDNKAQIKITDDADQLVLKGTAELFTIKQEERIVGERVETTFYYDQDSLFHPSVNVRFEIPDQEVTLTRGNRGSDRNPFYSSLHKVNISVDRVKAYLAKDSVVIGSKGFSIQKKADVAFESLKFFEKNEYQRFQNIGTINPIAVMKAAVYKEDTTFLQASVLAQYINSKFSVANIQSLLYDLVSKGFINYDEDKQIVEVKDKVFHYVDADQEKVDFDFLSINSKTKTANAYLDLDSKQIRIEGVQSLEFSRPQRVALRPSGGQVILKENRNLDFDGNLFAGFSTLQGKDFHFDYDKFQVDLDSVRYFDFFVPTGELDEKQQPVAKSIASRIEHLQGVLLIDAPSNKSGKDDIEIFPSLQSKEYSYIYYDQDNIQSGVYARDSFFFRLNPFSFNRIDNYTADDLEFKGEMFTFDIFPSFEETVRLQEDESLGYISQTPAEGFPTYIAEGEEKGRYKGELALNHKGLRAGGVVDYLGATLNSEDFIFKPKQMIGTAEVFDLKEDRESEIEVPKAYGENASIDWRPYQDSMYVRNAEEVPFKLFQEDNHTLAGTLILTPGGLKGDGNFDWDRAKMYSELFSFGAFSASADTTSIGIKAGEQGEELALYTKNVNGKVDFDEKAASFKANEEFLVTDLPYTQYVTSMNEFDWDMEANMVEFQALADKLGQFTSVHPDQDSLSFQGETATYDLNTNTLAIGGVPFIPAADAFIYPDSGFVQVQQGGKIDQLENARIVADTSNQYHVINRATVQVYGGKHYEASGFYEYNVGTKEQEFELQNIVGTRVGKGAMSEKKAVTRAQGEVTDEDNFYIDEKTEFQGTINLEAESKTLQLDGFARLESDKLPRRSWFSVSSPGDKKDLAIQYDTPKDIEGFPLKTGIFLSKEIANTYPVVMMPLRFTKDRPIFPTKGIFKYNKERDEFIFGDSAKIETNALRGNVMTFDNKTGDVKAEGRFFLGSGLKYINIDAAGTGKEKFNIVSLDADTNMVSLDEPVGPPPTKPMEIEVMAGIQLICPAPLLKYIENDFKSMSFDALPIAYLTNLDFYRKSIKELFPAEDKEMQEALAGLSSGILNLPKKHNPYTFLLSKVKMKWSQDYQSFVSTDDRIGVTSIAGEPLNRIAKVYLEVRMPSNNDDRLYIYIKSPSELFYFFGFRQGILNVTSNNPKFMEELEGMKEKDRIIKMGDDQTYEIQPVEPGDATRFVRRVLAAKK